MNEKTWTEITAEERAAVCSELEDEAARCMRIVGNPMNTAERRDDYTREAAALRAAVAFLTSGPAEIARLTAERDAWARLAKARGKRLRMPSVVDPATSLVGEIGAEIRGACEALRALGIDPKA